MQWMTPANFQYYHRFNTICRTDLINAQMNFEKENKLVSVYETPYGQMEMGIYTTGICLDEQDDFLELKLEYLLEINNQHVSDSKILLQIRPQQN